MYKLKELTKLLRKFKQITITGHPHTVRITSNKVYVRFFCKP